MCNSYYSRAERDSPPIFSLKTAGNPEHVTDLESGAIVRVEVRPGDAADNDARLCERVLAAIGTLSEALPEEPIGKLEKASAEHRAALNYAGRSTRSASGRALLRKRGQ